MPDQLLSLHHVGCRYKIRNKRFSFSHFEALKDVSFSIFKGETLGIVGQNGAGKSTLLKLISGILLPNRGEVVYHRQVTVSLLSLQMGFSPELSGRDNAIMGAMLLGYSKAEALEHLDAIIEFAELRERIKDPLKTYSTGMKARLGFAVAMKMNPDILLVDEALGVGDAAFREKSTKVMKEKMKSGQTVVFVSHQDHAVKSLCSRAAWLDRGVIRCIGDVEYVLEAYQQDMKQKNR